MTKHAKYGGKGTVQKVWDKAHTIPGKDPKLYRQDPYHNVMYRWSYGKSSKMGWEIDHKNPQIRGGSDDISNLQALNTIVNRSKGSTLVKRTT